jgi:O-antigen ligase
MAGLPVESAPPDDTDPEEAVEGDASTAVRLGISRAALDMWQRQPIVGGGLGSWEFNRPSVPTILQKQITTHNGYVWVLADLGLVGLFLVYILPIGAAIVRRPSAPLLALVGLVVLFEFATVGIAHSRYAVMIWSVVGLIALLPRGRYAFLTGYPSDREAAIQAPEGASGGR